MNNQRYQHMVTAYADTVFRVALNQTQNSQDAEDVVQNVFIKLFTKGPEDADDEGIKRWLIRVTVNECKSLWRRPWRKHVGLDEIVEPSGVGIERHYEDLYEAVAALPFGCRIVVHLFYFEGYSTSEIAQILSIKEPTVRTRLVRARKRLKQWFGEA